MTDLHTHILPAMDDGSRSVEESLRMLAAERAQGVDTVCLTPHFYPEREDPRSFLRRRAASYEALRAALPEDAPALRLGAEVAWFPTLHLCEELELLTLGESRYFLLELPFFPWSDRMLDQLYQLPERTGLTPVLAHVERFVPGQSKGRIRELVSMGFPMQMNASTVLAGRKKDLQLLRQGDWILASDCHNLTSRPPQLGSAVSALTRSRHPAAEGIVHNLSHPFP